MIARHLSSLVEPEFEHEGQRLAQILLHSIKHGQHFIDLLFLMGKSDKVYNLYIAFFNKGQKPFDVLLTSQVADSYLVQIIEENIHQPMVLKKPKWAFIAGRCLDNWVKVVGNVDSVLKTMSLVEIIACADTLPKYGIKVLREGDIPPKDKHYPFFYQELIQKDEIKPIFDFLKYFHGSLKAQLILDKELKREITLLSLEDLECILKVDPKTFISNSLIKKDDLYIQAISWVVDAHRHEGRLRDLDKLDTKELKRLFSMSILTLNDLDEMPRALNANKKAKLANDLEI